MKRQVFLLFLMAACLVTGCVSPHEEIVVDPDQTNQEWHIVVADSGLSKPKLSEIGQQFQHFLGEVAAPNDVVNIIAAPTHETIASVVVPAGSTKTRFRNPAVRRFGAKLKQLFMPESVNANVPARLRFPDLVNAVSAGRRTQFPSRVVVIGSALFLEPRYPTWHMKDGKFPSDGAIVAEYSPFNVDGQYPEGTKISWLVPKAQWGLHSQYEDAVTRVNRLIAQRQGGVIVRLTTDAQMAFVFDNSQFSDSVELQDEPAVMRQFGEPQKPSAEQAEVEPEQLQQDAEEVLSAVQADTGKIAIAMEWVSTDRRCDLDLWVESKGHAPKLYYGNRETAFGKHHKDVLTSTSANSGTDFRGMEWLEVNHNRLADLKSWINVYRSSKPAKVRVILVARGQRREKTIVIDPQNKWTTIDLGSL